MIISPTMISPTGGKETAQGQRARAEAATGMEGLFASMLLKQMRQTLEPGALFGSDNGDVLGGLFDATMGQHLSRAGGLGIAQLLQQQWNPLSPVAQAFKQSGAAWLAQRPLEGPAHEPS